jgi:peptidoglycan/LPS O-acetylase OafA/YrhL
MDRESPIAYRPALDGLRAFAVLAVIAYHLGYPTTSRWAPGGYLGVDAFFVISGYLITSLLLGEHRKRGHIQLSAFWGRRARRLLPAVLLLVCVVALYARAWADASQLQTLRGDSLSTLFYVANWHFIATHQSYFDLFSAPSPLRHMWSLAIEEQFYLIWPLVVFGVLRATRGRRAALVGVTVGGIIASAIWMAVHFNPADPSRAYYGTDTRAHSLLVGCLLALFLERLPAFSVRANRYVQVVGIVAAVGMLWAVHNITDTSRNMYYGGFLVYAVAVALVVMAAVQTAWSPLRSFFSLRPLRWIGLISYGLYLWHWPAIVILTPSRVHVNGNALKVVQVAAIFAVAIASYYLVERPIRYGKVTNRAVLTTAPVALGAVALVVIGATTGYQPPPLDLNASAPITAPPPPPSTTTTTASRVRPRSTVTAKPVLRPMTIAVVGDSVAGTIEWGLDDMAFGTPVRIVNAAFPGCGIAAGIALDTNDQPFPWSRTCADNVPRVLRETVSEQHPDLVLWFSSWELSDRLDTATNKVLKLGSPSNDAALLSGIDGAASTLTSQGARVVFLTVPPRAPSDVRPADGQDGRYAHYNQLLQRYAAEHAKQVSIIDIQPFVCPSGPPCAAKVRGIVLRPDGEHFTHQTAPMIAKWLWPQLLALAPAKPVS